MHEKEEIHKLDREKAHSLYEKEKESLSLQLQEKNNQILQVCGMYLFFVNTFLCMVKICLT